METIINSESLQVGYAVGVMRVTPGRELPSQITISWWFSEDMKLVSGLEERSKMMLNSFLDYVITLFQSDK